MADFSWHAAYYSDLQSPFALLVVPLAFLAWRAAAPPDRRRAVVPEAAGFVSTWTLFFAVATMIDPISTGPLVRSAALEGTIAATLIPFFFVLLGDLRVLLLAIGVARPERRLAGNLQWALGMTLIVPLATGVLYGAASWIWKDLHSQVLWMIYEFGFFLLCIALARVWVPRLLGETDENAEQVAYLRAIFGFAAAYYALWFIADVFIIVAQLDLGWGIRIIPNQLYYAFWVPFAYFRFFSRPGSATGAPPIR